MRWIKPLLLALPLLLGAFASSPALAHGRVGFGVVIGWPGPWYYPPPYYYPPAVVVQQPPPVYIQQSAPAAPAQPAGTWYYCSNPQGYYPYVKECPGGWQHVPAQPPGQ